MDNERGGGDTGCGKWDYRGNKCGKWTIGVKKLGSGTFTLMWEWLFLFK